MSNSTISDLGTSFNSLGVSELDFESDVMSTNGTTTASNGSINYGLLPVIVIAGLQIAMFSLELVSIGHGYRQLAKLKTVMKGGLHWKHSSLYLSRKVGLTWTV